MVDPWQGVLDPEWIIGLGVIAVDYAIVVAVFSRRGEAVSRRRQLAFAGGLLVIALALFSPIEHLALTSMLSFHLLQNVMLGDWAPPLLLLGLTPAMTASLSRWAGVRLLATPRVALGFWLATWYATHVPYVYDYSLTHRWALGVEHLAFLVSGLAFWWPEIVSGYLRAGEKIVYLIVALLAITPLDLVVYLSNTPLYAFYLHTPKLGGISALGDQQIAGAAMATEANTVLLAVILISADRLLRSPPVTPETTAG